MKRLLLLLCLLGNYANASVKAPEPKCQYTVEDARSGLKDYAIMGFVLREESADKNTKYGFMLYHNPKSNNPKSLDAMTLIMTDKKYPNTEMTFMVIYNYDGTDVIFQRQIINNAKLGQCFDKTKQPHQNPK